MKFDLFFYLECWKYEPNERPNVQKVVSTLKAIISLEQGDTIIGDMIITDINEKEEMDDEFCLNLSEATTDINHELELNSNINSFESENILISQGQHSL